MKLYMFRTISLSIIGSFSLYTQQLYTSYRFADSLQAGSGWNRMKLYMFRTVPLSIIRSFSLYAQQLYTSYRFANSLQAGSGWNRMKLYMFRTVPLSIIRSFSLYAQKLHMSYRFADSLQAGSGWNCVPSWSCLQAVCKPVWHMQFLCVQRKTPDDGQRNCPKHVEFHSKMNFRN